MILKSMILNVGCVCTLLALEIPAGFVRAQTPMGYSTSTADFTYSLERFAVAGTHSIVYLWRIKSPPNEAVRLDGMAFHSLSSPTLRKWIVDWQQGTVPITYITENNPSGKPETAATKQLTQELHDFSEFCRSHKEPFIIRFTQKQASE